MYKKPVQFSEQKVYFAIFFSHVRKVFLTAEAVLGIAFTPPPHPPHPPPPSPIPYKTFLNLFHYF